MTKLEYMNQLEAYLNGVSPADRQDIIQDFEEHFSAGLENGKSEEQICRELGSPKEFAAQYTDNVQPPRSVQAPPRTAYRQPVAAPRQAPAGDRRNETAWSVVFIILVCSALFLYPLALALMVSPVLVATVAAVFLESAPGALGIAFIVSLCIALFSAGLFIAVALTWLLKLSFKKSSF